MATSTIPWAGSLPYGSFEDRQANALKNAGGDPNSDMYKSWLGQYGPGGTNPTGTPFGAQAGNFNRFMTNAAVQPFIQNLPGYQANLGQQSKNTGDMLKGELPQDAVNLIAQQSAERGIGGGIQGSPNSSTALLRALGLGSLQMMGMGSQQFSQQQSDLPVPELFNPASMWAPQYNASQELATTTAAQNKQKQDAQNAAASAAWGKNRTPDGTYISMYGGGFMPRMF